MMTCPACAKPLSEVAVSDMKVDVCRDACHGVWLDNFELRKIDEAHESAGESLLDFSPGPPPSSVDHESKRKCPKCADVVMRRFFFSIRSEVEIDECPGCSGTWLDARELSRLRAEFKTEGDRKAAAEKHLSGLFDGKLRAQAMASQAETDRAQKFSRVFKYVLPSYWIPGKQRGGAF